MFIANVLAVTLGHTLQIAEPGLLAPKVLEQKSLSVFEVFRDHISKEDARLEPFWRDAEPLLFEFSSRDGLTMWIRRRRGVSNRDSLLLVGFRQSDGGYRSLTLRLPQVTQPRRNFSDEESVARALNIHNSLFLNNKVRVRRTVVDREETKIDVLLGTVIPGSLYESDTEAEYHMNLEFGVPSHAYFEPPHRVRNPKQLAVSEDIFLAEVVREGHKLSKWNGFDVRVGKPMYSRMLTYGTSLRELDRQTRKDLEDGYSVLTYRVAAWNPETWNEKEQRYMRSILFVVDGVTGKILSVTEPSKYQGGVGNVPPQWRPGFDLRGKWSVGGASGTFTETSVGQFKASRSMTLRQNTRHVVVEVDRDARLIRWNGKTYVPSSALAKTLFR